MDVGHLPRRAHLLPLTVAGLVALAACASGDPTEPLESTAFYALVDGIDGMAFLPPLGPQPTISGTFDAALLDGLSVILEAESPDGAVRVAGSFGPGTQPALSLLSSHERYAVDVPAALYLVDSGETYTFRVLLDGAELGHSVLSSYVFEVLARNPGLRVGVQFRVEGTAVRAAAPQRLRGGTPLHCTDGVQNKDEQGVDCGGTCAACETCTDGLQNQGESGVDCGGPCSACETCTDGIQNQGESGVDCGTVCGAPCGWTVHGCGMCSCSQPCACADVFTREPVRIVPSTHRYLRCASQDVILPNGSILGPLYELFPGSITVTPVW
ncbi:hypothetical protein L6R52_37505 [Myxococcota bacterium]|nr:hypothetical protein [Myxococcota bacterium]